MDDQTSPRNNPPPQQLASTTESYSTKMRLLLLFWVLCILTGCFAGSPDTEVEVSGVQPFSRTISSQPVFLGWRGGVVREDRISFPNFLPPTGYGLYVYLLPGDQVPVQTQEAIEQFDCNDVRQISLTTVGNPSGALMVVPVTSNSSGTPGQIIDDSMSMAFLYSVMGSPDPRSFYVVITDRPLIPQTGYNTGPNLLVINAGFLAPPFVEMWLMQLENNISEDKIVSPSDFVLKLRSVFYVVGSAGELIGIKPAEAEPVSAVCNS